jgi:hypothetical protein
MIRDNRRRKRNRRSLGWRPPPCINVNIMIESYDMIKSLALDKVQRNSPFYEQLNEIIKAYGNLEERLAWRTADLEIANDQIKCLKNKLDVYERDLDAANISVGSAND